MNPKRDTNSLDLTGFVWNSFKVLHKTDKRLGSQVGWLCRCVCGNEVIKGATDIRTKRHKSCGCKTKEILRQHRTLHGHSKGGNSRGTPTYITWHSMIQRCEYKGHKSYADYGGRGVSVCDRWHDFSHFLADMGMRPAGTTLGRIDNEGSYEPGNCRWETASQQARNRRSNTLIACNNSTRTLQEWSEITNIPRDTLSHRLRSGWKVERALSQPVRGC